HAALRHLPNLDHAPLPSVIMPCPARPARYWSPGAGSGHHRRILRPDGTSVAPLLDTTIASSVARAATDPERARIAEGTADQPGRWWAFGPYVSERAWGTVREDSSADGRAWEHLPHDHA